MTGPALSALDALEDRTPQGIAGCIARSIRAGDLSAGDRLPTVRDVAARLGVSPATVSAAWQALQRAGAVTARGRAGTFVNERPSGWLSPRVLSLRGPASAHLRFDLSRGTPDPDLLPAIGPALGRVATRAATEGYQEEPVLPDLRRLLARHWPWEAETITVIDGATDGIARTLELLVHLGDRVAVESPGFPPVFDLVEALGGEVVPLALDGEGVTTKSLRAALLTDPVAVVLQPRAHNPTGISMTPRRAKALAGVLSRHRGPAPVVIEDDHSGPISGQPTISLGSHLPERVVHIRSYSKSHGPDLRIAALGGAAELVEPIIARRMLGPGWTSRMVQTILLDLLTQAQPIEEVTEAARQYFGRQRDLHSRLVDLGLDVPLPDGINLWVPVRDERAAITHLAAADIRAAAGAPFYPTDDHPAHVRLTTGLVRAPDLEHVAQAIVEAASATA